MSGWIKLHRSIQQHWLYTEKRCFSRFEAWNDILLTVNYSDAQTFIKGKVYNVKRGQSILSLDSWANRWNWDKSKVRRFLNLLQKEKMIELKSDNITTHLIVCKYEDYQDSCNANETQKKRKRNANDIQTTPIEEEKEIKEGNNIPTIEEFVVYGSSIIDDVSTEALKLKYESWLVNGWCTNKDGKLKKIVNWKSTLNNTLPYLPKQTKQLKSNDELFYENVMKQLGK